MSIVDIFLGQAQQLYWQRMDDRQVVDAPSGKAFVDAQAYFVIRLKEMYLKHTRKLWRKFHPMLHTFVQYGGVEEHVVVGPGQLGDFAEADLDRVIIRNDRLTGPTVYREEDLSILVGLYSVPGEDVARTLIDTVSTIANLGGVAMAQPLEIARVVKASIDGILGLEQTHLRLGIRDTFYGNNALRTGYYVGIGASQGPVNPRELWLRNGQLMKGLLPAVSQPYTDHDYMVLEVEQRDKRNDWPGLPGLDEHNKAFADIMADSHLTVEQKRKRLNDRWPHFRQALESSPYLTKPDRELIEEKVGKDLNRRLRALESPRPIETYSLERAAAEPISPAEFDFIDVPDTLEEGGARPPRAGEVGQGSPF